MFATRKLFLGLTIALATLSCQFVLAGPRMAPIFNMATHDVSVCVMYPEWKFGIGETVNFPKKVQGWHVIPAGEGVPIELDDNYPFVYLRVSARGNPQATKKPDGVQLFGTKAHMSRHFGLEYPFSGQGDALGYPRIAKIYENGNWISKRYTDPEQMYADGWDSLHDFFKWSTRKNLNILGPNKVHEQNIPFDFSRSWNGGTEIIYRGFEPPAGFKLLHYQFHLASSRYESVTWGKRGNAVVVSGGLGHGGFGGSRGRYKGHVTLYYRSHNVIRN